MTDEKVIDDGMLCDCSLSGELHVVTSKTCCEVCTVADLMPLTAENVAMALKATKDRFEGDGGPIVSVMRDLDTLFELADRFAMLCHHAPRCAACGDAQVQVVDYFHTPALWKCRVCNHRFSFEPDGSVCA